MFLILIDSLIVFTSIYAAYFLLYTGNVLSNPLMILHENNLFFVSIVLLACHYFYLVVFRLYNKVWEYASIGELTAIIKSVTCSVITTAVIWELIYQDIIFRSLLIVWMAHLILMGGSRFAWRIFRKKFVTKQMKQRRALIVGAGDAGTMLVRQLLENSKSEINPIAFVDDDSRKRNLEIYGLRVVGDISHISEIAIKYDIQKIVIAIQAIDKTQMNRIMDECVKTRLKTVIMPRVEDLMLGRVTVNNFREVEVEDLLGREPIELDMNAISERLSGKTVLVTGAGGSIGSEICRQIGSFGPRKLILLGHGENSIYQIDMELRNKFRNINEIIPIIADVQDRERIFEVMELHRPDVVYHAAAHKHVPLMELNPKEAVKNNVIGTKNVAEAADVFQVKKFILISTDKAVNPTNVMGSTKRIAEMIIQKLSKESSTVFAAVRFGNVLGSRGSVIPLFKQQIKKGGPITVTHPEITRYFMTIPEASRLVLQTSALATGGEIFVLDMGEPVKIVDLARNLIRLSGYAVEEIGIEFTGIRPGEKMYEELLNESEVDKKFVYPKIFIGKANLLHVEKIELLKENLNTMPSSEVHKFVLELANAKEVVSV
jgi:FlaA1/EpsC-like NDP-sugar epimerase